MTYREGGIITLIADVPLLESGILFCSWKTHTNSWLPYSETLLQKQHLSRVMGALLHQDGQIGGVEIDSNFARSNLGSRILYRDLRSLDKRMNLLKGVGE